MENNIQPNIQPENYSGNNQITPPHPKTNPLVIISLIILILLISAGAFALGKYSSLFQPQPEVTQIKPTKNPTPSIDPTANWKTYNNEKQSFSLKYPANYLLSDQNFQILTVDDPTNFQVINIYHETYKELKQFPEIILKAIKSDLTIDEYVSDVLKDELNKWNEIKKIGYSDSLMPKIINQQETKGVNINAVKIERIRLPNSPDSHITEFVYKNNGIIYVLSANYGSSNLNTNEKENVELIFSTFRFLEEEETTPIPTTNNIQKLNYNLPAGWKTVKDQSNTFEVGYDPNNIQIKLNDIKGMISLNRTYNQQNFNSYISIGLFDYDGGSRHNFIFKNMGQPQTKGDEPSKYQEKEYLYNNHSCLFLENLIISQMFFVWGMCDAGGGKAFLISTYTYDYQQTLQTIKLVN